MSVLRDVGKIVRVTVRGTRGLVRGVRATATGTSRASTWVRRNVGHARSRSGVGNLGMMRLLDLHAISCAGDTLVTIGLAGTIFFAVPAGEARGRVALYLLVTMVPFALLAPLVGPLLDRFRHGRRYALATTMLGRALLAWIIADNVLGFSLYPAAFGVLALSRTYGIARSAAVPRLLPAGMGLSQAGARASVYGSVAGTIVAPLGVAAFWFGPQWPLRVASLIFAAGVVVALRLPPKADSDPPETLPKVFVVPWRHRVAGGDRVLCGRIVLTALAGSAILRALYGFLLLFLAFAIRADDLPTRIIGIDLGDAAALGVLGGCLALGTFLATAIGSGLRIHRPIRLQAIGLSVVALAGIWATLRFTLAAMALLCLATAIASGLAKLAVDASIQERIEETVRASAFAHAETLLMLAWVAGGAVGLIPLEGRLGVAAAVSVIVAAAVRGCVLAWRMRADMLRGRAARTAAAPNAPAGVVRVEPAAAAVPRPGAARPSQPEPVVAADEQSPPGFHIYRPSPSERGVTDPRTGP